MTFDQMDHTQTQASVHFEVSTEHIEYMHKSQGDSMPRE